MMEVNNLQLLDVFPYVSRLLLRQSKHAKFTLALAVAFLSLALRARMMSSKKGRLVSNLARVGRRVSANGSSEKSESELKDMVYDVIIVGGGTSGCVLASRISEDPRIKVLLLEAGGSGKAHILTRIPSTFTMLLRNPKHVFQFYTEEQKNLESRKIFWPRAKLLGGCSNINAMMAQYGSPGDYDEWAVLADDPSWKFDNFKKYFTKMETYQPEVRYPDIDVMKRGGEGPLKIGYKTYFTSIGTSFLEACNTVGIPRTKDFIWQTMGASRIMSYVDANMTRSTSETAYLTDDVLKRPNLQVVVHAIVTKIIFHKEEDDTLDPRAVGVEFMKESSGVKYVVKAKNDVIVSSGAVHSPQILMLSGIGPAHELAKHNIPVVCDIPAVGELVDHPSIDLNFRSKDESSLTYMIHPQGLGEMWKIVKAVWSYFVVGTGGPLAAMATEGVAFVRSDDTILFPTSEFPEQLEDSTSSKDGPDIEIFSSATSWKDHGRYFLPGPCAGIHACLLRPTSKGRISLKSASPWDPPLLNPNYLSTTDDAQKVLRAIRLILKITRAKPMGSTLNNDSDDDETSDFDHGLYKASDEDVLQFIRNNLETLYHPACTCKMGTRVDEGAVVDSRLKVFGVRGLRVCDASVFPKMVSGHTAGACFAMAEKLSEEIKAEY